MTVNDNDLCTELENGDLIPVRQVGEFFIVAYDHVSPEEFILYASQLPSAPEGLKESDVEWSESAVIILGELDGIERVSFSQSDPDRIPITFIQRW